MGATAQRRWADRGVTRAEAPRHAMSETDILRAQLEAARKEASEIRAQLERARSDLATAQALLDEEPRSPVAPTRQEAIAPQRAQQQHRQKAR